MADGEFTARGTRRISFSAAPVSEASGPGCSPELKQAAETAFSTAAAGKGAADMSALQGMLEGMQVRVEASSRAK